MRRFSQRHSLVTLSEINITPLLDLAFVLLIIFIITTPLLEASVKMNLPVGGQDSTEKVTKEDLRTIEVAPNGQYVMQGHRYNLKELERDLITAFKANPKLAVRVRADKREYWENVVALMDMCMKNGINRVHFAMKPAK